MKLCVCICFLVVIIGPCANAKSFDFGNFFLGSGKKSLESESVVPRAAASQDSLFDGNHLDSSTEVDSYDVFNSSYDDIFDSYNLNSSSDYLDVSSRNESDNFPAMSGTTTAPEVQNKEIPSSDKTETTTTPGSSTVPSEKTSTVAEVPSTVSITKESTSTVATEQEEVVLGTTTGATAVLIPRNFFQKSIDWVQDAYTLSILIPITAGVLFATTIIVVVALCRCLRRCCRRRQFKRKPLPDSVKSLRPSDRARLLGDTSDEEF